MVEESKATSVFGISSVAVAAATVLIFGGLIAVRLSVPDGWMNGDDPEQIGRTAHWVFLGNWSIVLFPLSALFGLILGSIGRVQTSRSPSLNYSGIALNALLLVGWFVGMIGYQLMFHSDALYVK